MDDYNSWWILLIDQGLSQVQTNYFVSDYNYKQANTIAGWLNGCMVELETESVDEDIIDVDKKNNWERRIWK